MDSPNFLLILLLFFLFICISGKWAVEGSQQDPGTLKKEKQPPLQNSSLNGRKRLNLGKKLDDFMNSPATILPSTTPVTNPATFPPYTPTPTIITVPGSNPSSPTPTNPVATPITTVPNSPITNPAAPVTEPTGINPVTVGGTGGTVNVPVVSGQTWCIARAGVPEASLQSALDYACGIGGADCSMIQQGASCYNPNSIENHASYAFNSYFQKNPVPSSCDFGGTAVIVNTNPSSGTCVYPSSASTTAMPSSMNPPATTSSPGATGTSYGIPGSGTYEPPPSILGATNPDSGSPYGLNSPPSSSSMPAGSVTAAAPRGLRPCIGIIILVAFFSTG